MRTLLAVLLLIATTSFAADPGAAIATARKQVRDKQYGAAIKLLQDAIPDASAMSDARERTLALAAIHFYSAVAFTGLADEWKAKEELEQFFHFSPQTNSIDPAKYDQHLVRWFNEVYESMKQEASSNFDAVYPGYRAYAEDTPKERPLAQWGDGPELTLLGTSEEKAQWRRMTDDDTRRTFIDSFWSRRAADYRLAFTRRAVFADHAFANEKMRGSMTDRGRVFVLLGPPRVIKQKPLSQREAGGLRSSGPTFMGGADVSAQDRFKAMEIADRNMAVASPLPIAKASVERWVFSRDQLPRSVADAEVVFKFVTEEGYGDHVLQRDFMVTKALHDAGQ